MRSKLRQLNIKLNQFIEIFDWTNYPQSVQLDIPYFAQWESPALIADFIAGAKQAKDDPDWVASGAASPEHYQLWAPHCCGMACLKMILADSQHQVIPIITLAEDCAKLGGYTFPLEQTVGLQYLPFKNYLRQAFNLYAIIARPLTVHKITKALAQGQYVMASVSSNIDLNPAPPNRAGHLVLITGYDLQAKTITFHNPGGRTETTRANSRLNFNEFNHYFKFKGLIINE